MLFRSVSQSRYVRHRVASYAQESTRYCNYSKGKFGNELTFIDPCWNIEYYDNKNITDGDDREESDGQFFIQSLKTAEKCYFKLLEKGWTPQEARSVLPNALKTEINVKMNLREWRHFFNLRCASAAHPQMRELAIPLLEEMRNLIPIIFDDLYEKYCKQ